MFPVESSNQTENVHVNGNSEITQEKKKCSVFYQYKQLFCNKRFNLLCISTWFMSFGFSVQVNHMQEYSRVQFDLNETQLVFLTSIFGIANLISKLFQGLLLNLSFVKTEVIYFGCFSVMGIAIMVFPLSPSYTVAMVLSAILGATYAAFGPATNYLTLLYVGQEMLVIATGTSYLTCGTAAIFGSPCAGKIIELLEK